MRTETDALLSLQRYVNQALPGMTEVLTELERGAPPARPFAVVSSDEDLTTGGMLATPWATLPATVHVYLKGTSRTAARKAAEDVREALWAAFYLGLGDGRPMRVPLFDYTGKPAVQRLELTGAKSGTWTIGYGGEFSDELDRQAQPRDLRLALEPIVGVGVEVLGRVGGPWAVRFSGALRGLPFDHLEADVSGLVSDGSADPPDLAVSDDAIGDPAPWRAARDFLNVEQVNLGGLPDPGDPTQRTITAGVRLTWARGGRVPSAEMQLTGTEVRGRWS